MKAISVYSGTTKLQLVDRPQPTISAKDEIKMRVIRVGICGTDREEAAGGRSDPPAGKQELVIGHEMIGRVEETGGGVTQVRPGDYAVFTVRRGCNQCLPCLMNRSDMCETGNYLERGIKRQDGFQAEYVVDREAYVMRVPAELEPVGVLCEPLSVAEKAIDETVNLQFTRLPDSGATSRQAWLNGRRCLVAGLGPIGLLAAMALRLRGAEVFGLDIVDAATARPQWLEAIGGRYLDGRLVPAGQINDLVEPMELIFEATGIPALEFNLLDALALNGIYVLTGIPNGSRPLEIPGGKLIRQLVLNNQVIVGSVNAARVHYEMAEFDLDQARLRWGALVTELITHRYSVSEFDKALRDHPPDEIKAVIEWTASHG